MLIHYKKQKLFFGGTHMGKETKKIRINEDVREFAKLTLKKYKKENGNFFDSKKETKESYYMSLVDLLPEVIMFVVKFGHVQNEEIQNVKTLIYQKLTDYDFIKVLKKELKNKNKIKNIKLFPIIIQEILEEAKKVNDQLLAQDKNAETYRMDDIQELLQIILKKRLKKFAKAGIDTATSLDVLSIIPCDEALDISQFYRIKSFFDCLYEHVKGVAIPFETIMSLVTSEEYYPMFITFALLERKERFAKFTEAQKTLYVDISTWCFKTMEGLKSDAIKSIINVYINGRKKDDSQGKDGNRRYNLSTLVPDDYPKITKVINAMLSHDESIKKYL
jgi:hypothetical protein